MRLKILLISFVLSLPFWWGINILAENLEDFWVQQEIVKNPEILTAAINQKILERKIKRLKLEKLQQERLRNLEIEAKAAISVRVSSQGNEKILFDRNSQEALRIASLTKLMTALVVFDLDETYKRDEISVENLLDIMLIESSNKAASALAKLIGERPFVELMNLYAKDLGLKDTRFVNATGLEPDEPEEDMNYSTAKDLVQMAKYILENEPEIFEITRQEVPQNTNELLGEVPGIIGGKTGWGPEAGGCLLLVLDNPKQGGYFINIVLGAKDRFAEMRKLIDAIK